MRSGASGHARPDTVSQTDSIRSVKTRRHVYTEAIDEVSMAKQGRPKSATTSVVISIRVDEGVLEEIDRLMDFRFRAPIGRETYLRMILYGDEPPVSPAVERDNLVRVDFRLPSPSVAELAQRIGDGNRSEHIRRILMGLEECLSPLPDEYDN